MTGGTVDAVKSSAQVIAKVCLVKAVVFPGVAYGCEGWTIRKAERQRTDALNCGVGEELRVLGLK